MRYTRYILIAILFIIGGSFSRTSAGFSHSARVPAAQSGVHTLVLSDTSGATVHLTFGVDSRATNCIDRALGEIEQPPPPPLPSMFATFINNDSDSLRCLGNGVVIDYHRYSNPSQIDTFTVKFQRGSAGYPLTFHWDSLAEAYSGPVTIQDVFTGTIVSANMKAVNSVTITNVGINEVVIIASGPIYTTPNYVMATTDSASNITETTAKLFGSVTANAPESTWVYFQYTSTDTFRNDFVSSKGLWVVSDSIPVHFTDDIDSLLLNTSYYYRAVATNQNGTSYGAFSLFKTKNIVADFSVVTDSATFVGDSTATLNGTVYRNDTSKTVYAYFYWDPAPLYLRVSGPMNVSDTVIISGPQNPASFHVTLHGLKPASMYGFIARAFDGVQGAKGDLQVFTTSFTGMLVTTNEATNVTDSTAVLNGTVLRSDTTKPMYAYFDWLPNPYYMTLNMNHTDSVLISGPTNPMSFSITLHSLQPSETYGFIAKVTDGVMPGFNTVSGKMLLFTAAEHSDTLQFNIPITIVDGAQTADVTFGLHPYATYCIDANLGEIEFPPFPPQGTLDLRFVDSRIDSATCLGQGTRLNLHHYYSSTQTDTFLLAFQPGLAGYPVTFHWQNISKYYTGAVTMTDQFGGLIVNVDMKAQDSVTITNHGINRLQIIATGPAFEPAVYPLAVTDSSKYVTSTSAEIFGTVYSNGLPTVAHFEWGANNNPDHETQLVYLDTTDPHRLTANLTGLTPGTNYVFRLVATNTNGTSYGTLYGFTTLNGISSNFIKVPITCSDSIHQATVWFGVHPQATNCIDSTLGEIEMPPVPYIGIFDVRLLEPRADSLSCYGGGIMTDLRPFFSTSQADTYFVRFQPGTIGAPMTFTWPDLNQYYYGPVTLLYIPPQTGGTVTIDMKAQQSVTLPTGMLHSFFFIAKEPKLGPVIIPIDTMANVAAFWKFDDASVGVAVDSSSHHNDGTAYGTTLIPGKSGTARHFNGYGDYINVPDSPSLNFDSTESFTISAWFRTTFTGSGEFLRKGSAPTSGYMLRMIQGHVEATIGDMENSTFPHELIHIQSDTTYNDGLWHHAIFARVRPLNKLFLVVDGVLATQPVADTYTLPIINERSLNIGRWEALGGVEYYSGDLDEIRITREVFAPPIDNIAAYWKFEDQSNMFVYDSSRNHNDGTAHGTMLIAGKYGMARHFNGAGDFIQIPNSPSLNFDSSQGFTISAWFRTTDSSNTIILQKGIDSLPGYEIRLEHGHVQGIIGNAVNLTLPPRLVVIVTSESTYNDGQWHQLIFSRVRHLHKLVLMMDNVYSVQSTDDYYPWPLVNSHPLLMGRELSVSSGAISYSGDLDEIKIITGEFDISGGGEAPSVPGAPGIISIADVPNDQGKQVFVKWFASSYQGDQNSPITHYSVWRNDGAWTFIGDVPVRSDSIYSFVAPTLYDSTIVNGIHWTWFEVTAHTADPTIFYTSSPAKGYSIDNLAPHVPDGFAITVGTASVTLRWNPPVDNDFQYFIIYRSDPRRMTAVPVYERLATTTTNEFTDHPDLMTVNYTYRVTAVDFSGNESKPSVVLDPVLGVKDSKQLPATFALHQNYPNPFNPSTNIQYDLPSAAFVMLKVYNILGEEVAALVNEDVTAGIHTFSWNAGNMPSGVYQYRIIALPKADATKPFVQTFRMVLVK
jgi:hypothetical protein